ncbi:MAG TPA: PD-(D/E)XK nuclease family protein, partial [Xanthobacteraceae bacterium]|nr:PD-(D/E)XK nuclease family protein [Xanthobacteraceae bacterium]
QRLQAVSGPAFDAALARGQRYLAFARRLDVPATAPQPTAPPEPRPPLAARPRQLSVTAIENLLRDPYTIYAQRILRLTPLDAVDTPPGAADRGTVIHGAIEDFVRRHSDLLPDDAAAELLALGRARFRALDDYPEARAFWWPRFVRVAQWFAAWETERRPLLAALTAEADGRIIIPLPDGDFTLTARADRIEHHADGAYAIVDYKTGRVPSDKEVASGLSPQMTLEAAILRDGGFAGIPKGGTVRALTYVGLKGGEPPGVERQVAFKNSSPDTEADRALAELTKVLHRYADPAEPYRSLALSMWSTRYGDYDHLARVKEWAGGAAGEDDA